jgi:hypothetical protein
VPTENRLKIERRLTQFPGNTPKHAVRQPTIIYRSGLNPKIQRNFEVFSPCDFIARITQHIPDKSFQLVRYYG